MAFASDRSGTWRIYVAAADGSGATPLTTGEAPEWSPGGDRIAFHRAGGVYVIDANGANERFLRAGRSPSWSPTGAEIAFQSGIGSGGGVYVMNADGTEPRLVVSHEFASPGWGDYCVCSPAWSPAGDTIAFVRANYDDGWGIYTTNVDGSGAPVLLRGNGWSQDTPAWSPGGARIAFATLDDGGDIIGSVTANDSDFRVHARAGPVGYVGDPAWSPDGASLLFVQSVPRGVPTRIFIVRSDGAVNRFIPEAQNPENPDYFDRDPSWSWRN